MRTSSPLAIGTVLCLGALVACADEVGIDDSNLALATDDNGTTGEPTGEQDAGSTAVSTPSAPTPGDVEVFEDNTAEIEAPPACGDGALDEGEVCDDGNTTDADGCNSLCSAIDLGFDCSIPGAPCVTVDVCGDGRQTSNESCDDGNVLAGDGCSASCMLEADHACPTPGEACLSTVECGDGAVSGSEQCDDGATLGGDGCSATCQVESGWACPTPGQACVAAACGDGLIAGTEECEDGNAVAGDGCSATCAVEIGFVCETTGAACRAAVCGDGVVEGGEACDDGDDTNTGDGCSPGCILEPNCDDGACTSACGDGLILPDDNEECDDGNLQAGDGCSPDCQIEVGFECETVSDTTNGSLSLPIVYRDFRGSDEENFPGVAEAHPDFERHIETATGLVEDDLGVAGQAGAIAGKPVYTRSNPDLIESRASFNQWYRAVPGVNVTVVDTLTLNELAGQPGSFRFQDNSFFPLDGIGWAALNDPDGNPAEAARNGHNYFFTSELTYWFEYQQSGGSWPRLDFTGDDDVWVFINRKLAVDIGGVHGALNGSVTLDPAKAAELDLEVGKVYEIKLFQAERHTSLSQYRLTLSGFTRVTSQCASVCGDGVVTPDEVCDDGEANGDGYGMCTTTCEPGPRCGDGVVDAVNEQCDNGLNLDVYQTSAEACAPGCLTPSSCGDGVVDAAFGETCDDGVNDNSYNGCSPSCQLGPRCGDGAIQEPQEACDDGNQINGDGCNFECQLESQGGPK